jgi:hypothetical protein
MNCQTVRDSLTDFLDGRLPGGQKSGLGRHLAECRDCAARADELAEIRRMVRSLPERRVPEELSGQLRVIASHERSRRLKRMTWHSAFQGWLQDLKLASDNAMRPFALPIAGGLCSALAIFVMLMPTLGFRHNLNNDVPTALYTEASMIDMALIEMAPFNFGSNDEIVVEVSLDERGEVTGYTIPYGAKLSADIATQIGNVILFTSFRPATLFFQPTPSKLLVKFRRDQIIVKG